MITRKVQQLITKEAETELVFFVNGKKVTDSQPDPEWTLLWYLRNKLQLTGTKYGCGEGGCGACTVMLSQYLQHKDTIKHVAVNACLIPVCAVHGMAITTVEGIGTVEHGLHPVQERIAKAHGSQCGFCTPGFVMSMYTLLRNKNQKLDYHDIETALQGNLCRCTGYRPIIEGFRTFSDAYANMNGCPMGENCCKNKKETKPSQLFDKSKFKPYHPTQEPIFPPELKVNFIKYNKTLCFKGNQTIWLRPNCLDDFLLLKQNIPESKIVVGNTEIGVEMKIKNIPYPVLISPTFIPELNELHISESGYIIGATLPLTELKTLLEGEVKQHPQRSKIAASIADTLHWFAGTQVRNVVCIAGNIATASPISDLNPILMACGALLHVSTHNKERKLKIDEQFFTSYRKTSLSPNEVILSVEIPFSEENQYFKAYKQARRRDDDISIVTGAFNVKITDNVVTYAKLCFGGMGPTTMCAEESSSIMIGQKWNQVMLDSVFDSMNKEFRLDVSVPGGMAEYRKSLCMSMFMKYFLWLFNTLAKKKNGNEIDTHDFDYHITSLPKSSQYFDIRESDRKATDSVGLPVPHASALKQATGEALYCDDLPHVQGEVFLSMLFSTKAHAKILSIDASKALAMPGVIAFLSAKDLDKNNNKLGPIFKDEEIFSSEFVTSRACAICAIVAEDETVAKIAKTLVVVEYEELPAIITIEEAINQKSYFPGAPRTIKKGDVAKAFAESDNVVEGTVRNGAQEHFYLETFCAFAKRIEDEIEIVSSTQSPAEMAALTSHALNIPNHKVIAKTKRLGGGFGGKETRSAIITVPVAIAAYKLRRPVRAVFDRDEDMQVTGNRHPILTRYRVAFNNDGKITGAKIDVYSNAGNSMDISCSMNERAVTHVDNCYKIPNMEVNGYLCKTNMPSNTAFRGFGGPQAMFASESIIRHVARKLGKTYEEVAEVNLYHEGDLTHFNQSLSYCTIRRCWRECMEASDYWRRKQYVEEFNRCNRWCKKGLTIVPTKYGISFGTNMLMQAGALLMAYTDGSVLLAIGGIEMGQGLFTKMIQVASKALEIDIEKIHISEMSTDKVPNSSPTAASISSDLYGMAVLDACNILLKRLEPIKKSCPEGNWDVWISKAYEERVNLSATGYYAAPRIMYNPESNTGDLFEYFTYGVACSEVQIDCLTGDHSVLRTDIVMDLGESLNPAIDIGQVEGAFMQGYGMFTIEELVFSPKGLLLSRGPGAYKIPAISDIPKEFNVSLLKGAPNPRAVYSSKAVGEPPLFLAASVFFAIYEAIKSARAEAGVVDEFQLNAPATCSRIRMACEDEITRKVEPTVAKEGVTPWNIDI